MNFLMLPTPVFNAIDVNIVRDLIISKTNIFEEWLENIWLSVGAVQTSSFPCNTVTYVGRHGAMVERDMQSSISSSDLVV